MKKFLIWTFLTLVAVPCFANSLFFEDEPVQDGLPVFTMSETFADVYEKLDGVNWGGKNLNLAIESLENINSLAHIAATDERIVLVWRDTIVGNFARPKDKDWNAFGEITTALILKMRQQDPNLRRMSENDIYQIAVESLVRGLDEHGKYVLSKNAQITEDGKILTSVGVEGARDARGYFRVTGVYKGSPADGAGIKSGDLIVEIDGMPVTGMSGADLASVMTGFNSGTAKIKLLTPSGQKNVVLRRASIALADADVVYRNDTEYSGILEIVVHKITNGAVDIINRALAMYPDVYGIILDLRAASGDDERAVAKLAGLFMGQVPVMRVVETAREEVEIIPGGNAVTDVPVVVLVSDMTRGTAEALAAAFYENQRGVLVGTPTAGQARIASQIDLKNGGMLELLNKSVKTGSGRAIDNRGVFPIVCLSNIRSNQQQNAFFVNVVNNDFNMQDFNKKSDVSADDIRRGCPTITSGTDEDAVSLAVAVKILTDKKVYNKLIIE
ncbi:MAG: S41 family peptidase [Alphaproteobacteria bacterium]|nr:S41 family peptidase [Alphaproteobacteria bacterium]